MSTQSESPTNRRVEISGERWVEVRRLTADDVRATRMEAHERGWDDAELDALFLIPLVIVESSFMRGEEVLKQLDEVDYVKVWAAAKGVGDPNPSSRSSAGTPQTNGKKRRSNG